MKPTPATAAGSSQSSREHTSDAGATAKVPDQQGVQLPPIGGSHREETPPKCLGKSVWRNIPEEFGQIQWCPQHGRPLSVCYRDAIIARKDVRIAELEGALEQQETTINVVESQRDRACGLLAECLHHLDEACEPCVQTRDGIRAFLAMMEEAHDNPLAEARRVLGKEGGT